MGALTLKFTLIPCKAMVPTRALSVFSAVTDLDHGIKYPTHTHTLQMAYSGSLVYRCQAGDEGGVEKQG